MAEDLLVKLKHSAKKLRLRESATHSPSRSCRLGALTEWQVGRRAEHIRRAERKGLRPTRLVH